MRSLPRTFRVLATLAAVALLPAPPEALAQAGKTFQDAPRLTTADIAMVRKLVREELTGKPNGTTLSWSNPDSTNSGTVTLMGTFASKARDCRRVQYRVEPGPKQPSAAQPVSYLLTSCRLSDGTWQIDNQAKPDNPQ